MGLSNGYANGHTNGQAVLDLPASADNSPYATLADGTTLTHAEWLVERDKDFGIGASDVAKIVGKAAVKLWYQKKGLVPDEGSESEQAWWGIALEPLIAQRFEQLTGEPLVSQQVFLRHPEYSWLYCTIDRLTLDGGLVELKALSNFGNDREDGFGWDPDNPPAKWIYQAQQQMAVTGEQQVRFAVFYGPELAFRELTIFWNPELWAQLLQAVQAFRQSLIENVPPTDFQPDDAAMISKLHRGKADGPVLELNDPKLLEQIRTYCAHADLGEREKEKDRAKAAIFQALGTSTSATIAGYKIVRKVTAKQTRLEVIPPASE